MIALSLAGRAFAVYPVCLAFARTRWAIPLNQQHLMWWGGLRGALALALALSLPADLPRRDDILISAFAVVAFSVIIQGLTAPLTLRALGLHAEEEGSGHRAIASEHVAIGLVRGSRAAPGEAFSPPGALSTCCKRYIDRSQTKNLQNEKSGIFFVAVDPAHVRNSSKNQL